MRELKFRAWDDVAKRMSYSNTEQFDDMLGFRFDHFETDKPVYMQYTGLHDRNGREIYEGDILEEHYTSLEISRYKVEWDQESAMWVFNDGKDRVFAEDIDFSLTEVKGNKWDHPHLLKGEGQ